MEAGMPDGVINIVPGFGETAGAAIAEHMDIEFGPVTFRSQKENMWLPASADIYFDLRGRRIRRRNTFTNYLLFTVNEKQSISAPKESKSTDESSTSVPRSVRPLGN